MDEEKTFYIDPVNRNIDIVLILVAIVLMFAFGYMYHLINENEATKIRFNINDVENIKWIDETNGVEFNLIDDKLNLVIDYTNVIEDATYTLNEQTGEIIYKLDGKDVSGKLYIRSIGEDNITIWYNYAELHLDKEVEVK